MAVEQHGTFGNTVSDVTRQGKYRQLEGEYDFDEDPGNVLAELDDRNNMVVRLEAADAIAFFGSVGDCRHCCQARSCNRQPGFEPRLVIDAVRVTPRQLSSKVQLTTLPQCSLEGG